MWDLVGDMFETAGGTDLEMCWETAGEVVWRCVGRHVVGLGWRCVADSWWDWVGGVVGEQVGLGWRCVWTGGGITLEMCEGKRVGLVWKCVGKAGGTRLQKCVGTTGVSVLEMCWGKTGVFGLEMCGTAGGNKFQMFGGKQMGLGWRSVGDGDLGRVENVWVSGGVVVLEMCLGTAGGNELEMCDRQQVGLVW